MLRPWFRTSRILVTFPLVLALVFAVACGSTTAEPETIVREVTKQVEVVTETEVTKVVPVEVTQEEVKVVVATPLPTLEAVSMEVIKGESFNFPIKPAWVRNGKVTDTVLEIGKRSNPGAWDAHYAGNLFSALVPTAPQFSQLTRYNPVNPPEIVGDLARGWDISPDGTEYTFRLHDATWTDGTPVTADDIVFSLDRITDPDAIRSRTRVLGSFYERGTATAVDDKTVKVPLKFPAATFLPNMSTDYMKMYARHNAEQLTQDEANLAFGLIGSGAWILKNFEPNVVFEYERNPNYFGAGRPFLGGLKFNIIGRSYQRVYSSLQVGQIFSTEGPLSSGYRPEEVFRVQEDTNGRMRALTLKNGSGSVFILHTNKPPFDDPRVRRAFSLGLDRAEIVDVLYCQNDYGQCFGGPNHFAIGSVGGVMVEPPEELAMRPGYGPSDQRAEDYAEAKKLLADAGYPNGIEVNLNVSMSSGSLQQSEIATEQLRRNVGIDVRLDSVDTAANMQRLGESVLNLTHNTAATIIPDAADNMDQHFLQDILKNPDNWSDARLDELLAAQAKEIDSEKRQATFQEMVEILHKGESHVVPLVRFDQGGLMDYRIRGYHVPTSIQLVHSWDQIWWDADAECPDERGCK
jgi:ABC-type transport system substrate-binding protein